MGSWLALFALAFQLAVSFGHMHLEDVHLAGAHHDSVTTAPVLPDVDAAPGAHTASLPAGDETPALADDCCPVCALIHLVGTVVAAQAPAVPVPALFGATQADPPAEFRPTARSHALFAARAPPIA
jgi:hypothetical protein